jgi:hypothetical protein
VHQPSGAWCRLHQPFRHRRRKLAAFRQELPRQLHNSTFFYSFLSPFFIEVPKTTDPPVAKATYLKNRPSM